MNSKNLYFCIIMVGVLLGSQDQSKQEQKPKNNPWTVHLMSIPLTFLNYYSLTRAIAPLTVKTGNFFYKDSLSTSVVFPWMVFMSALVSPVIIKNFFSKISWITADELNEAQRNALVYTSLYYLTPDSLKNRVKSVPGALQRLFFRKSYQGISVKSFEQSEAKVPIIKKLTDTIKSDFEKLNTLEAGNLDQNFDEYRQTILDFSISLVKRETERASLYENYSIGELSKLQAQAHTLVNLASQKAIDNRESFLDASRLLKTLYAQIQGGSLGLIGQALRYFEGEKP